MPPLLLCLGRRDAYFTWWGRANQIPRTMDNAVDSAAALYMDIIDLFLRSLVSIHKSWILAAPDFEGTAQSCKPAHFITGFLAITVASTTMCYLIVILAALLPCDGSSHAYRRARPTASWQSLVDWPIQW
jgi:hypothetical protein